MALAVPAACALLISACGGGGHRTVAAGDGCHTETVSAAVSSAGTSGSWPDPNANLANTRDAPDSAISAANVSRLKPAWAFKLTGKGAVGVTGYGSLVAGPIVQDGVVYLQDLDSNVYALALGSGKLEWEYCVTLPSGAGRGPTGWLSPTAGSTGRRQPRCSR